MVVVLNNEKFTFALLTRMAQELSALTVGTRDRDMVAEHVAEMHLCLRHLCEVYAVPQEFVDSIYSKKYNSEGGYDARLFQMEPVRPVESEGDAQKPA